MSCNQNEKRNGCSPSTMQTSALPHQRAQGWECELSGSKWRNSQTGAHLDSICLHRFVRCFFVRILFSSTPPKIRNGIFSCASNIAPLPRTNSKMNPSKTTQFSDTLIGDEALRRTKLPKDRKVILAGVSCTSLQNGWVFAKCALCTELTTPSHAHLSRDVLVKLKGCVRKVALSCAHPSPNVVPPNTNFSA